MNLDCIIVEDESISRSMIENLVSKTNFLTLKGSFTSGEEAMPWLLNNEVDLIFLDIEMPGITGIDLLKSLITKPEIIIISANPEYAIDAFDFAVSDYLLKPIKDYGRFLQALSKVISQKNKVNVDSQKQLYIKIDSLLQKLDIEDILWVEALGDYVKIQTSDKLHTVYSTLKKLEERLSSEKFSRVHRSYIVNLEKINNIDSSNLTIGKKIIPISDNYKKALFNKIKIL